MNSDSEKEKIISATIELVTLELKKPLWNQFRSDVQEEIKLKIQTAVSELFHLLPAYVLDKLSFGRHRFIFLNPFIDGYMIELEPSLKTEFLIIINPCSYLEFSKDALIGILVHELAHTFQTGQYSQNQLKRYKQKEATVSDVIREWGLEKYVQTFFEERKEVQKSFLKGGNSQDQ